MSKEIERKFLVDKCKLPELDTGIDMAQGYLHNTPEKVVRIRTTSFLGKREWGYITVKGANRGMTRDEYEYDIPYEEAKEMMDNLCGDVLEKTRYLYTFEDHTWEIDFFKGTDIIIAEVELHSEDEEVVIPEWAIKEVTDDPKYYNSNIIKGSLK